MSIHLQIIRHILLFYTILSVSLTVSDANSLPPQFEPTREVESLNPTTSSGLDTFYQAMDYKWQEIDQGVPPFKLNHFPHDIDVAVTTKVKKRLFFMGLLPMVLLANQEIFRERSDVMEILQEHRTKELTGRDRERLNQIMQRYSLRGRPLTDHRVQTRLLRRVDIIPPSLVLAQAANESAWGTSRFVREGNNIFGEWTFKPGTGIVPKGRPDGATYEVRKFNSLYESVRSYMNNLNTHWAYRELREMREEERKNGGSVSGSLLAQGLFRYSERGIDYVNEIKAMIRQNKLDRTNIAELRILETEDSHIIRMTGAGLFSSRNRIIGHRSPSR